LNNFKVEEPGQVWAADITYIPMREGFMLDLPPKIAGGLLIFLRD
jgi:hypothetical protein